jgi:hypothetical protein
MLQEHQLFIKRSKWKFGSSLVAYLSHGTLTRGVAMDE